MQSVREKKVKRREMGKEGGEEKWMITKVIEEMVRGQ